MIVCEQVGYAIREARAGERAILHPLSFSVETGSIALVQGPSGAGKSTLLSIVAGVLRPTEGQVLFNGEPVSRFTAAHRDRFRRRVGLVTQRLHLFDELTSLENVLLPHVPSKGRAKAADRAMGLLDALELSASQTVRSLSGGEQQRVAIARALSSQPEFLVLDEPSAHQDEARVAVIAGLLREAVEGGSTLVIAAHDARLETQLDAGTRLELRQGRQVDP